MASMPVRPHPHSFTSHWPWMSTALSMTSGTIAFPSAPTARPSLPPLPPPPSPWPLVSPALLRMQPAQHRTLFSLPNSLGPLGRTGQSLPWDMGCRTTLLHWESQCLPRLLSSCQAPLLLARRWIPIPPCPCELPSMRLRIPTFFTNLLLMRNLISITTKKTALRLTPNRRKAQPTSPASTHMRKAARGDLAKDRSSKIVGHHGLRPCSPTDPHSSITSRAL